MTRVRISAAIALSLLLIHACFPAGFFLPPPSSESTGTGWLDAYASSYNSGISKVPSALRFLFSGEKATISVSGWKTFRVKFGDRGEVEEITEGSWSIPSLEMRMSAGTLEELARSPPSALEEAVLDGRVVIRDGNPVAFAKLRMATLWMEASGTLKGLAEASEDIPTSIDILEAGRE